MFCPRCSQEQISEETRYCKQCGFPLGDVAESLANGGFVDRKAADNTRDLRRSISVGILLMVSSFIFFIVSLVIGTPEPSYVVQFNLFVTLVVFLLGMGWVGYSLWMKSRSVDRNNSVPLNSDVVTSQLPQREMAALPNTYTPPANVENTRSLEHAPSVTENTTKFLEKDVE